MGCYTTFAASVTVIVLLAGGGLLRTSLGDICGDTPAKDQASFADYVDVLLGILVKETTARLPDQLTYDATVPGSNFPGSVTGTATCYDQGDITYEDCSKCLSELLPYLEECETTSSTGGASLEGRCMIQFHENLQ
ncbi:unnamed protein product [Linum trigynum]|uniref:Gnk2-homologous domain-containing protein n=1 Tax=Linum trigynum TaxID=586398 RepID=A0AAV2F368_9ROSI